MGNRALTPEQSTGLEAGLRAQTARTFAQVSTYYNRIGNYIRPTVVGDTDVDGELLPLVNYRQDDAALYGLEGQVETKLPSHLVGGVMGDFTRATFSDGGKNPQAGLDYIGKLVDDHIKVQPKSGREATETFLQGTGDVLLSYENEALFAEGEGDPVEHVVTVDQESAGAVHGARLGPPGAELVEEARRGCLERAEDEEELCIGGGLGRVIGEPPVGGSPPRGECVHEVGRRASLQVSTARRPLLTGNGDDKSAPMCAIAAV